MFRRHQHTLSKVLCLALGLAVSSVLIAEIYFEQTFDTHFSGASRTYQLIEYGRVGEGNGEITNSVTPGGWAPELRRRTPIVEAATRISNLLGSIAQFHMDDGTAFHSRVSATDTCFFDVFPQRIIVGNAKKALSSKGEVLISASLAKTLGGDVVGRRFTVDTAPGYTFTIGGVYEDFPWGSSWHQETMLIGFATMDELGMHNYNEMLGADSYASFVRLAKGHKPSELKPFAEKAITEYVHYSDMQKAGYKLHMGWETMNALHTSDSYTSTMRWVMTLVAVLLLVISVMNYLLITVSGMVRRSREMAVRKCYGARRKDIYRLIFSEAAADVGLAVVLAALLVWLCKGSVEGFLSAPVAALVLNRGAWLLVAIVIIVLLIAGLLPAWLYNRTPVSAAFRGWAENKHRWKLALLAVEFAIVGLMLSLLAVIGGQYAKMTRLDPGYDYDDVAIFFVQGIDDNDAQHCLEELRRLPEVKLASFADRLPIDGWCGAGNNVSLAPDQEVLFNAEDFYSVGDDYFRLMGLKIVSGQFFTDRTDTCRQVMVDEAFARKLAAAAHFTDGVVGKRVCISEHCNLQDPLVTIVGVYKNIQIGGVNHATDGIERPSMMFYGTKPKGNMLLKLTRMTPEVMAKISHKIERMFPGKQLSMYSYASEYAGQYKQQLHLRDGILLAGVIVTLIALFELVGYTADEVQRRSKEIAIRKVNGARARDILRLFIGGVMRVAVPSVIVGCIGAWLVAARWLENFTVRITLSPLIFIVVAIAVLLIIAASVAFNCWRVSRENPVKYLKDE